jgi:hypothetical protein
VKDWAAKKAALMALWRLSAPSDIADHFYPDDPVMAEKVQGNLDHWEEHYPVRRDGPGPRFFRDIAARFGLKGESDRHRVANCTIAEFVSLIPEEEDRRRVGAALGLGATERGGGDSGYRHPSEAEGRGQAAGPHDGGGGTSASERTLKPLYQNMLVSLRNFPLSIAAAARSGRLDQKHFYLTPDAAQAWISLVRAEAYPTYDQCKAGLRRLAASDVWNEAIARVAPETVVMLAGGGAPTKDLVLIHALLRHPRLAGQRITYYLIDISPYMLTDAFTWLHDALQEIEGGDRIEIKPVRDDVLDLSDLKSLLEGRRGAILFGITGGTIGNLSENAFFDALEQVSRPGDLLILSADTIPEEAVADDVVEGRIVHKYDHPDLRRFIGPAVRSLAAELELDHPVKSVFDALEIGLDDKQRFSDVPNSLSLTMDMQSADRRVNMLSSTRYRRPELRDFVNERGWRELDEVESPFDQNYVQFFLERFE